MAEVKLSQLLACAREALSIEDIAVCTLPDGTVPYEVCEVGSDAMRLHVGAILKAVRALGLKVGERPRDPHAAPRCHGRAFRGFRSWDQNRWVEAPTFTTRGGWNIFWTHYPRKRSTNPYRRTLPVCMTDADLDRSDLWHLKQEARKAR